MTEMVEFLVAPAGELWRLTRQGTELGRYSHVERAAHEAVQLARALRQSGEPATVLVEDAEGRRIEVSSDPEAGTAPPHGGETSALDPG